MVEGFHLRTKRACYVETKTDQYASCCVISMHLAVVCDTCDVSQVLDKLAAQTAEGLPQDHTSSQCQVNGHMGRCHVIGKCANAVCNIYHMGAE